MRRRLWAISLSVLPEALMLALGSAAAVRLATLGLPGSALLAAGLGVAAAGLGLAVLGRAGDLAMAWRCPRLRALSLSPGRHRDAPWGALAAADAALEALSSCGTYREFFPEARRHLVQAAFRALAAQALARRAREALGDAPEGEPRARLEAQEALALREVAGLTASLKELKARFVAATAPAALADSTSALRELGASSDALAESIDQLHRAPEWVPAAGGRP